MRSLAAIALLVLISGCGQTGPLYLPGETPVPPPATQPEAPIEEAAAAPTQTD